WNKNKVLMQEIRFTSPFSSSSKLKWNAGVFGFLQDNPVRQGTYYGKDAGMFGSPVTNFTDITTNSLVGNGFAGFGQIDYKILPSLSLIAGLRYDYEHKKQGIEGVFLPDGGEAIITRSDTSSIANFSNLSPKLAFDYSL